MLSVSNVSKRFGGVLALDDVSLEVPTGGIVGFLGPNGSGKTTTMRLVMGLLSRDAGTITWRGEPITDEVRRTFGYMPAERGTYPKMRVGEQLEYFARLAGRSTAAARASSSDWLERVGLSDRADDEVQALSSGNQQRVQLAIALVHEPDLLILDEPFSGLDPIAVETMKDLLLEQVARGVTVLLSSHQLDLVSDVCRDVVIVNRGRVVLEGPVQQLRSSSPTRDVVVTVAHGDVAGFVPTLDEWDVVAVDGDTKRMRVPSSTAPTDVFEAVGVIGPIAEFSFTAPELSDVFISSVDDVASARTGDASQIVDATAVTDETGASRVGTP
jgi:ABC-2 type transport system ATP-binding protein